MSLPDVLPPVAPLPGVSSAATVGDAGPTAASPGVAAPGFSELVTQGLDRVNEALLDGQSEMQRLAAGKVENLHQVMLKLEESRLSFQLMVQVRNRLLESYQDVMRMQV